MERDVYPCRLILKTFRILHLLFAITWIQLYYDWYVSNKRGKNLNILTANGKYFVRQVLVQICHRKNKILLTENVYQAMIIEVMSMILCKALHITGTQHFSISHVKK